MRFGPGTPLLTPQQFRVRGFFLWVYAACWVTALFWLSFVWEASALTKMVTVLLLVIVTPTCDALFMTYKGYRASWEASQRRPSPAEQKDVSS